MTLRMCVVPTSRPTTCVIRDSLLYTIAEKLIKSSDIVVSFVLAVFYKKIRSK